MNNLRQNYAKEFMVAKYLRRHCEFNFSRWEILRVFLSGDSGLQIIKK